MTNNSKVLVVDDDDAMRMTVAANIESEGYVVVEAADGESALALAREHPDIEVVVSDVRMPGIDGVEMFLRLKNVRDVPVILVSAYTNEDRVVAAREHGVHAVMQKPLEPTRLMRVIEGALKRPNVLVVDDDPAHLTTLVGALQSCGLRVLSADSGQRALSLAREQPVDVVVLDLLMPDKDGLETLRELRAMQWPPAVIIISGAADTEMLIDSSRGGAYTTLRKPVDVHELLRVIVRLRSAD